MGFTRSGLAVKWRKRPDRFAVLGVGLLEWRRTQHLQGARHRVPERLRLELHPAPRAVEQPAAPVDLRLEVFLAFARGVELLGRDPLSLPVEVRRLDLPREAVRVAVANPPAAKSAFDVVVDHLGEAAELVPDGLGLLHQHVEDSVLGALRKHEVVAAHRRRRLQLAVDALVPLLDAAGVPGEVEVEEVSAVRLEVEPLEGGVGGDKDAQGVADRVRVETALNLLRFAPTVCLSMVSMRSSARSVPATACSSIVRR